MNVQNNLTIPNDTPPVILRDPSVDKALLYASRLWYCIFALVGILFVARLITSLLYYLRMRNILNDTRHGTLHTIGNITRIMLYRLTVFTGLYRWNVAETCIILGYLLVLLIFEFTDCYSPFTGATLDLAYWSTRAGVLAMCQLPLVQALGAKNNVISLLTGISYEKLSILHRAVGRIGLGLVYLHFISHVVLLGVGLPGFPTGRRNMGILAASTYTVLFLLSIYPFRKRFYGLFFGSHVILAALLVIAIYFHTDQTSRFNAIAMPFFIFWVVDRLTRTLRVVIIYVQSRHHESASMDTIQLLSQSVMLVTLHRKMTWQAGQHVYLTVPTLSRAFFEAHPFTIASIPESIDTKTAIESDTKILRFIIRARNGFTKRLLNAVENADERATLLGLALIDGPYGIPPNAEAYRNVIFIAGGTGVSFTLPLLQSIVKNSSKRSLCRFVSFCWIVSHYEELNWVASQLLEALNAAPQPLQLCIRLYVSRSSNEEMVQGRPDRTNLLVSLQKLLVCNSVRLELKKPDIKVSLRQEIDTCIGSTLVAVSGPVSLADDVRNVLQSTSYQSIGKKGVYLHVETYRTG